MSDSATPAERWYSGVTAYQWLVLVIASAGWVFDAFEGQLFNLTRADLLAELLSASAKQDRKFWGDLFLAIFLVGGATGGIAFGSLADRWGRRPTMALTILAYSIFSGLTFFATQLWHIAALRFLVALGVGGEWAVAASLIAEVFPARARAQASGIFHATSILGTWMAGIVAWGVGAQWRYAYLIGVAPALLVLAVRTGIEEPESWRQAVKEERRLGSLRELLGSGQWARQALLGMLLAAVGLGLFWGVTVAGQDLTLELLKRQGVPAEAAADDAKLAYAIVQTTGGGLGLLAFGPLAARFGRKPTFALMLVASMIIVPITCYLPQNYTQMLCVLPLFGFFTLSIHAGYAVYFPELFPGHLRATGSGFCFNGGRMLAAPILWLSGYLKSSCGFELPEAVTLLSGLCVIGLITLLFLPETRGRPLPE